MAKMTVLLLLAVTAFIISARSFKEKGFLFNKAYLFASKQERKSMDKKRRYRQAAVIFCLLGVFFFGQCRRGGVADKLAALDFHGFNNRRNRLCHGFVNNWRNGRITASG
ncbi:MAG: DUF3784 domain-containing protein [Oscillospiraceae bacterium]